MQPAEAVERYELRDPFANAPHRSRSLEAIIAKAEELGSSRFVAIAEDGRRTPVTRSGGEWHRGKQLAARTEHPLDTTRGEPSHSAERGRPSARSSTSHPHSASPKVSMTAVTTPKLQGDAQPERAAYIAQLEADLQERYIIKKPTATIGLVSVGHTEYRFREDTSRIAFTESAFRLATDTNNPSVARSMIDVALARNWKGLRVSGSEDFRRLIWLEASLRGVKALGYEPNPADVDSLKREREAQRTYRVERVAEATAQAVTPPNEKGSSRASGGRKAVVAAIEAILRERGVPAARRNAVLDAANEQLAQRARTGQMPKIRIYDPAAAPQRASPAPLREPSRARERAAPAPVR
ncbi:LPD7 domain-containing protein [Burkholderiaceae bacterium UC74_6]